MPVYEYKCNNCGEKFEQRRLFSDSDSEIKCPKCREGNICRVFSIFSTDSPGRYCAPGTPT